MTQTGNLAGKDPVKVLTTGRMISAKVLNQRVVEKSIFIIPFLLVVTLYFIICE